MRSIYLSHFGLTYMVLDDKMSKNFAVEIKYNVKFQDLH